MDEKLLRMAQRLRQDPAALQSLMNSPDGQALLHLLTQGDQGASFQQAVDSATRGDPGDMARMIRQVMQSPGGAALVERINKASQK